jgi:hypothetical protein
MGHAWKKSAAVAGIAAGCALAACSSSSKENVQTGVLSTPGGPGSDAGATSDGAAPLDAGGTVSADDAGTRATSCTAAPFVGFAATLATIDPSGSSAPLAGATIGFTTCAGFALTTDSAGKAATQITEGLPLSPFYSAGTAVIDAIGAEIPATTDVAVSPTLFARAVAPFIPGFAQDGGNAPAIVLSFAVTGTSAPCNDASGVTFAVTGAPTAVVSYGSAQWPADPTVTATPTGAGYVFVSGLAAGTKAVVTGAKAGCTVQVASPSQTGSFLLVAGAVTVGVATLTN